APLRAHDGDGIDELAEHHLHRPRQRQPDVESGKFHRTERQRLLDPEAFRNRDQAQRAVGEIDHHQRQISETEGPDRIEERVFGPLNDVIAGPDVRCGHKPGLSSLPLWRYSPGGLSNSNEKAAMLMEPAPRSER